MTNDITALIEQGKKLAEAADVFDWYGAGAAYGMVCDFNGGPYATADHDAAHIAHHSPATMLRLYAEIDAKDAIIKRLQATGRMILDSNGKLIGQANRVHAERLNLDAEKDGLHEANTILTAEIEAKDAEIARTVTLTDARMLSGIEWK